MYASEDVHYVFFFFKQKTAYEMRISDWSSDVCSSDLTGGMTDKRYGRIGDSPIIGAGTYANARCAVSGTGWGEFYIRVSAAHEICARMAYLEETPAQRSEEHTSELQSLMRLSYAVICLKKKNRIHTNISPQDKHTINYTI